VHLNLAYSWFCHLGLWPEHLIADTGYGSAAMLDWLVHEQAIEPHIPGFDKSTRKGGTFSRADFTYDHRRNLRLPWRQGAAALPASVPAAADWYRC
jgi:hypothetical protein